VQRLVQCKDDLRHTRSSPRHLLEVGSEYVKMKQATIRPAAFATRTRLLFRHPASPRPPSPIPISHRRPRRRVRFGWKVSNKAWSALDQPAFICSLHQGQGEDGHEQTRHEFLSN